MRRAGLCRQRRGIIIGGGVYRCEVDPKTIGYGYPLVGRGGRAPMWYRMERKQMRVWGSVPIALRLLQHGAQANACMG